MAIALQSHSQSSNIAPGYQWELFKGTSSWELAKAVELEDTSLIYRLVKNENNILDLKEPKFGKTLLMLAIGNEKMNSVKCLINVGARIDIKDSVGDQAIHEAVKIDSEDDRFNILKLLIEQGADVNSVSEKGFFKIPLQGVISDFSCAKLLLDHGADLYFRDKKDYLVWTYLLSLNGRDNIFILKYLIVDKKVKIPNPITYTLFTNKPIGIFDFLAKMNYKYDKKKQNAKNKVVSFLHDIGFPKNNLYIKK